MSPSSASYVSGSPVTLIVGTTGWPVGIPSPVAWTITCAPAAASPVAASAKRAGASERLEPIEETPVLRVRELAEQRRCVSLVGPFEDVERLELPDRPVDRGPGDVEAFGEFPFVGDSLPDPLHQLRSTKHLLEKDPFRAAHGCLSIYTSKSLSPDM
jgi:hypothetical protein